MLLPITANLRFGNFFSLYGGLLLRCFQTSIAPMIRLMEPTENRVYDSIIVAVYAA